MRVVLLGAGSFIAHAVIEACKSHGADHLALRHDADVDAALAPGNCLINFAIDPRYRTGPYDAAQDCDLRAAQAAARHGAHFVMLSTRRVYGPAQRWNAVETGPADGDETAYGRNKAVSEKAVQEACDGKAGIFRLSNIFGFEYNFASPRRSFLGQLLFNLKQKNTIFFNMAAGTRRDFLPVETCASLLVARALDSTSGTCNLGSGLPLACGELAALIMEGYGGGELVCEPATVTDEFFLNMDRWHKRFEPPANEQAIRDYCSALGRRLKCEKF